MTNLYKSNKKIPSSFQQGTVFPSYLCFFSPSDFWFPHFLLSDTAPWRLPVTKRFGRQIWGKLGLAQEGILRIDAMKTQWISLQRMAPVPSPKKALRILIHAHSQSPAAICSSFLSHDRCEQVFQLYGQLLPHQKYQKYLSRSHYILQLVLSSFVWNNLL